MILYQIIATHIFAKIINTPMSTYKSAYNEKTVSQVVPIIIIGLVGVLYFLAGDNDVSFILIGIGALAMIFWARVIKKTILSNAPRFTPREQETKNWMYDLFQGESEYVFVAEVPGPEGKIVVRLIDAVLYIRGNGGFYREVPVKGSNHMQITDFQYKNGVLTLRIS